MKLWREKNATQVSKRRRLQRVAKGDHIRARRRQHYTDNKAAYIANACKREADKLRATPAWADYKLMLTFYERAEEMTRTTGIEHHVDHIVPLRSRRVCGLHSHHNLQVLTAEQNLRKGNRLSGD
jgi:5-methylcytosine-specific restriction endonuclease McrA